MKQHRIAVAAVVLLFLVPVGGLAQGATDTGNTLRLTFQVDEEVWSLTEAQLLPEPFVPRWTLRGGSYYAALLDANGAVQATVPLGRPELLFHDHQDESAQLAGGVQERSNYSVSVRLPLCEPGSRVVISDNEQRELLKLSAAEIEVSLSRSRADWPAYAVDTLMYSGDPAGKIDIVFLGDGYVAVDSTVFLNTCDMHLNYILGLVPFAQYSERFNVYAVMTFSNQRGADHPEWGVYKDTYYNAEYWGRLLTVDFGIATGVANQHVPQWDQICVIVQDPEYGGSGAAQCAVSYSASTRVLAHEFGHSFGQLWDEYSYGGNGSVGAAPNCDDHVVNPKWQDWIDSLYPGVGTYLGCSYDNTYRPTASSCMMLELKDYYCIVCVEQLINRIYDYAPNPIAALAPTGDIFLPPGESQLFEVSYANQTDHPLLITWYLDEVEQVDSSANSFYFTPAATGLHVLRVELYDTTSLVLNLDESTLTSSHTWHVNSEELTCGDCNSDALVNITDIVYLIQYIFAGGPPPTPLEVGDADCNGVPNISDAVYLVAYIFAGGPVPCADCRLLYSLHAADTYRGGLH
ncbi:MAG: M64 family metallopeptidase [bacterium]